MMDVSRRILSDLIVFSKYARYVPELQRRETWDEIVMRNEMMHLKKFPELTTEIDSVYDFVRDRKVLPSMRAMQFAGKPIEISPARAYNCSYMPMDHFLAFSELMFLLLSGCGVGYSVQFMHVQKLPVIRKPHGERRYLIGDSIEGWADAVKALVRSYLDGRSKPRFDFSDIRARGLPLKTSGGKAPGPEPLRIALEQVERIFERHSSGERLSTVDVHDINCHLADAVLSGGIRRSSMIALFDVDDEEMLNAKHGSWWEKNPQRALANNSAVVIRHKANKPVFEEIWSRAHASGAGEPGVMFSNDKDWGLNPCAEISLRPHQFCNLTTINASDVVSQEDLNARARAAAYIGTLQASYTDFHYLRDTWKTVTEKESLIGVSMTGIANANFLGLDLHAAANEVKAENERVAAILGINKAARCTTVKPEGTTSLVLGSSSGIHAWHSDYYVRRVRVLKNEPIYGYFSKFHPELLEDEVYHPEKQSVISLPIKAPEGSITRNESAMDLLTRVSYVWKNWVKTGHRKGDNINNVSTTVTLRDPEWRDVGNWMWDHKDEFTALSVLPYDGGSYVQAPFEEINEKQYTSMMKNIKPVDFSEVMEYSDDTDLKESAACQAGACEVT